MPLPDHQRTNLRALAAGGPVTFEWLFLDLNSYFASVEQQERSELRGRPVAVVPVETDYTCAIAASYEAKAFGIKTGTPIKEARWRCPELRLVLARHDVYVDYHHRVLAEVDRHVPVFQVASIDEMACRLTGKWCAPEAALALARQIKAGLARRVGECLRCSIGLSTNRFLAKVATDLEKPDGLVALPPQDLPGRLLGNVPRDLPGIGPSMERRLHAAGIFTFAELWACAPKQLRAIWGSVQGERLWYALRGVEIPEEPTQRGSLGHSHVLAPEQRPPAQAEAVGRRLLLKAASRLRRIAHVAGSITLSVRLVAGPRHSAEARLPEISDSTTLQEVFTRLWAELMEAAEWAAVKKISVTLHRLTALGGAEQLSLLDRPQVDPAAAAEQKARRTRLSAAIDEITRRYGRDAITTGILPGEGSSFTGTKIAFNRVPDRTDFDEVLAAFRAAPRREARRKG
jgi:DNA polymerase-4